MSKPMKKYVNGFINKKFIYNKSSKHSENMNLPNDLENIINKKVDEGKIHDSRLDPSRKDSIKELNESTKYTIERAKQLFNINDTENKKSDILNNYKAEYRRKHEIRDFKDKSSNNNVIMDYNEVFKDL